MCQHETNPILFSNTCLRQANLYGLGQEPCPLIMAQEFRLYVLSSINLINILYNFRMEHKANMLWIPPESPYNTNKKWLDTHFEKDTRDQVVVFESENILTPDSIKYVGFY